MDTSTTRIYTLSLHDALPISLTQTFAILRKGTMLLGRRHRRSEEPATAETMARSEEHTSELQSLTNLVCRLLLEKKNKAHRADQGRHRGDHHRRQAALPDRKR